MFDLTTMINTLHRPRLLTRTAKIGAQDYDRERHLQRILGYGSLPKSSAALIRLLEMEREVNALRQDEDAAYSLVKHLDLLIAVIGEAQLYQASRAAHFQ